MSNKFEPHVIIRLLPAVYKRESLPPECADEASAIEFAIERALHWNRKVCLVFSEVVTFWVDKSGQHFRVVATTLSESNRPHMRINGKRFLFQIDD